jgi:segregation and condensation protein B
MDETEIKHVVEAALLAAGRPLTLERLGELFAAKGGGPDRATLKRVIETLANDYQGRGVELKEVATGYRLQIKRSMSDWLQPLWEERAPRYTRALLETLALVAYRQPITRAEIEEVRGVVVSTNIIRTLLERSWIRVVGHRDVPGKPAMFGTTKEFLDYFGLKKLEELPTLAEIKDGMPELSPQTDLVESIEADARGVDAVLSQDGQPATVASVTVIGTANAPHELEAAPDEGEDDDDDSELAGPDLVSDDSDEQATRTERSGADDGDTEVRSADVIPLRAADDEQ